MLFAWDGRSKERIGTREWEEIGKWRKERVPIFVKQMMNTLTAPRAKTLNWFIWRVLLKEWVGLNV